jgi:hypothetical protein
MNMTLATIEKAAKGYLAFFKAHEKILIIVLLVAFGFHVYDKGLTAWVDHDKRISDAASIVSKQDADTSKQMKDQLTQLTVQVQQQGVDLKTAVQQRAADTQKQKKTDDAMTPTELTARLQKLLNVGPQDVTWSPINGDVVFTEPAAHTDADALEDLSQLKADKVSLQSIAVNDQSLITSQANFITQKEKELADEKTSHADDVKTLKAENHKQYMRGLKHGVIIGVIGGEVLRVLFTHKP